MTVIATSRNLSMDTAGLIGRASGAGKSAILDAAAVRAFSNTLSSAEVASAISAAVSGIDLSGYLPLSGGTLSGNLGVSNIVGPGGSTSLVLNNAGTGGTFLQDNGGNRAWIGGSGVGIYTACYPINSNLYDLGLTTRFWRKLFVGSVVPLSADLIIRDGTTAQAVRIDKTYTSDTNCEFLRVGWTGSNFDITSEVGSAGGSNQPVRIGSKDAAGTFAGLTVSATGGLYINGSVRGFTPSGTQGVYYHAGAIGTSGRSIFLTVNRASMPSDGAFSFTSNGDSGATVDTAIYRNAAGVLEINNGTAGTYRDLICRAITASGNLTLQNSTTAVLAEFSKTYTSSTNREYLNVGFTGTNYDLCSRVGSAGGSNQPIRLGHLAADGTTFTGLTVATSGALTTTSGQSISSSGIFPASLTLTSGFGAGNNFTFRGYNISTPCFSIHMEGSGVWHCRHRSPGIISWSSSADATGAADTAIGRNAAGVVEINNGTAGTYRDLIFRDVTLVPSASRTLAANGQFSIEMTSNTAGNLVYRGSDGTTRRFAFTVS